MIEEIKRTITECDNIDSLSFDTWGRDYGLLVERDYPMRQPFVCSSSITKHIPQKYIRHLSQEELYRATGIGFMSTSTLFQLMVEKGKALDSKNILFMSDLFAWALCGNRTVDRTIASTSQLVNPLTGDWNYNITLLTPFRFLFFPVIAGPAEAAAIGNILLQLIALQAIADVGDGRRIIRKSEKQIMYHPQNSNLYNEKYQQFCNILHIPSPML